jgi:hypothetical protein
VFECRLCSLLPDHNYPASKLEAYRYNWPQLGGPGDVDGFEWLIIERGTGMMFVYLFASTTTDRGNVYCSYR